MPTNDTPPRFDTPMVKQPACSVPMTGRPSCDTSSGCKSTGLTACSCSDSLSPPCGPQTYDTAIPCLAHCREGANQFGRCYAVMYDLSSGLRTGATQQVIQDWILLVDRMRLGRDDHDRAYLKHNGKPVVAVWGIGFNDGRKYTIAECDRLVDFLKNDPKYGGNTVMVGVPTGWRTLNRDAIPDPALHATLLKADIISPWTVGRYSTLGWSNTMPQPAGSLTSPGARSMARSTCRWSFPASVGTTCFPSHR